MPYQWKQWTPGNDTKEYLPEMLSITSKNNQGKNNSLKKLKYIKKLKKIMVDIEFEQNRKSKNTTS